jgi:hypothetical protein
MIPIGIPGMGKGHLLQNDLKKALAQSDQVLKTISLEDTIDEHMAKYR